MRRRGGWSCGSPLVVVLAATVVPGCSRTSGMGAEVVVARVGERVLTVPALASLLVLAQPMPLEAGVAEELARHWLGLTLVSGRWAAGDSLLADAEADAAIVYAMRDSALAVYRASRFPELGALVARRAAAVANATEPRLIAHVLRRAGPGTRPEERELQRRTAERVLAGLRAGRSWVWANEENEDESARSAGGVIGLISRGELPAALDTAVFSLAAGEYSNVIESPFGYHVLHRPRVEGEWRDRLESLVRATVEAEADSVLGQAVWARGQPRLAPGAAATARAVARDPWRSAGRMDTLATVGGEPLTAGMFGGIAAVLPVEARQALLSSGEEDVTWFVLSVAERQALWQQAESDGAGAAPNVVVALREAYRLEMRTIARELASAAPTVGLNLTDTEHQQLAEQRVKQRLEAIASRRADLRPVPPLLLLRLLERESWSFDSDAIRPALERARVLIDAAQPTVATRS